MYQVSIAKGDEDRFLALAEDEAFTPMHIRTNPTIVTYHVWTAEDTIEVITNEFPTALVTTVE